MDHHGLFEIDLPKPWLPALQPGDERAAARPEAIVQAGRDWLAAQGERHGFRLLDPVRVDGYARRRVLRAGAAPLRFATLDLEGWIEVAEPEALPAPETPRAEASMH